MISKELLSKVLGYEVEIRGFKDKYIPANFEYIVDMIDVKTINIYELAHKCKEWAYNQGYVLDCFSKCTEIRKKNEEDILYIERGELFDDSSYDISLVFKACQWILDNKEG